MCLCCNAWNWLSLLCRGDGRPIQNSDQCQGVFPRARFPIHFVCWCIADSWLWFKIVFAVIVSLLFFTLEFSATSEWLFDRSVDFLKSFNSVGSDYVSSSVIICFCVPIVIYLLLFGMAFSAFRRRRHQSKLVAKTAND